MTCSGCRRRGPTYDRLASRRFQFVPLWGPHVFFIYAMRRVDCKRCGVLVATVPWAEGKSPLATAYAWLLAGWARRLSWQETAHVFRTSWDAVFRSVRLAVTWGLAHRDLEAIEAIGIDEIAWRRGPRFLTVVYQIDAHCRQLLWIGPDRRVRQTAKISALTLDDPGPYVDFIAVFRNYLVSSSGADFKMVHGGYDV